MITENVRTVIDVVVILVGIPALYDLSKKIKSRFWRSNSGVPPPSATNLVSGSAFALLCGILWSLSYVSLKYVSGKATSIAIVIAVFGWATLFLYLGRTLFRRSERTKGQSDDLHTAWDTKRVLVALIANLGNFGLSILALYFISATQAMTLNNMSPLFLAVIWPGCTGGRGGGDTFAFEKAPSEIWARFA